MILQESSLTIYVAFVMFTITRETLYYINLRQAYLLTPWNASRISSRTVLFTSVPKRSLDGNYLRQAFEAVKRVWIIDDCVSLKNLVDQRDSCVKSLEDVLVKTAQDAVKRKSDSKIAQMSASNERPSKRTKPLIGSKEDAIEAYSNKLVELNQRIEAGQNAEGRGYGHATGAVFIEFDSISAAQTVVQSTTHPAPFVMESRAIGAVPSSIIWDNLSIPAWQGVLHGLLATSFIIALTIFWSIPTSFIGILSNVSDIADRFKWLNWINDLPEPVLGAIEGLLPSFLLSYVVSLVPTIFRYVARLSGEVTTASVELKTQEWYFIFQVIQVFFVTTLASGATAVTSDIINDPKMAPELLAKKLPKASNFYLSYFIIYGFGQSTKNLMNWSGLFFDKFFGFFDRTPREKYERYTSLSSTLR